MLPTWKAQSACSHRSSRNYAASFISAVIALLVTSCGPGEIKLAYRFDGDKPVQYRWEVDTTVTVDSPESKSEQRMQAVVDVAESSRSSGSKVLLTLHLTPVSLSIDGRPAPIPASSSIELEALESGAVEKVLGSTLFSPGSATALEVSALLAEHRPPLSEREVTVGDTWPAPLEISNERNKLALTGRGKLTGFDLLDRRRAAEVSIDRSGKVTSTLDLGKAPVQLDGDSKSTMRMLLDIDEGQIVESATRSTTRYSMSFQGGGPAGTVVTSVNSKLRLV